jgi:hypothetical protein
LVLDPVPLLDLWEHESGAATVALASKAIVTGSFRAATLAQRDIYRGELLHPDPTVIDHDADR